MRLSGFVACEGTVTGAGTGKDSVEESGVTGAVSEDESDAAGEKTLDHQQKGQIHPRPYRRRRPNTRFSRSGRPRQSLAWPSI